MGKYLILELFLTSPKNTTQYDLKILSILIISTIVNSTLSSIDFPPITVSISQCPNASLESISQGLSLILIQLSYCI